MNSYSSPTDEKSKRTNVDRSEGGRVKLLVDSEADRRLLKEELSKRFEVDVTNTPLEMSVGTDDPFDVCIFDRAGYQRNLENLVTYKERMKPVLVPYLLVCPRGDNAVVNSQSETVIDEVIETPIEKATLSRRIERLLEMRRLTLELSRQKERLDEFASMVSHDLRNPLDVAEGHLELAAERGEEEDFERVSAAHERMRSIIDDVLALARTGPENFELGTVNLSEVIRDAWKGVETAQASSDFAIEDSQIAADEGRLRQLLENLYRNAIEHGGKDVTVRVGALESGFYVEDDGPGIPTEDRDQAFEYGYSTADEGTGFGLSIVQQIADAHNWNIRITEGSDGGARFEIRGVEIE